MVVMDTAVADLISHVMGHYNGGNLGPEILIELLSLCFWSMRPTEPSQGGLLPSRWARARRAVQRQWALVLQVLPSPSPSPNSNQVPWPTLPRGEALWARRVFNAADVAKVGHRSFNPHTPPTETGAV